MKQYTQKTTLNTDKKKYRNNIDLCSEDYNDGYLT